MVVPFSSLFRLFASNVSTFRCLAEKNDVIDIIVTEVGAGCIKGKIGHAEVLIPRARIPEQDCEYNQNENIYLLREELKIDKESKLRCKVVEIEIKLSTSLPI